jgi:hypothetical protein
MQTTTEDLIERLAREVRPVRPVAAPAIRTMVWLVPALAWLMLLLFGMNAMNSSGRAGLDMWSIAQQLAAAAVGIAAAFAAFASVVPGRRSRLMAVVIATSAAWVAITSAAALRDHARYGAFGLGDQSDWSCVVLMTAISATLVTVMIRMLRRAGAPLTPRLTTVLAGLAASAMASLLACLAHAHPYSSIVLVWHGGTALLIAALVATVGRHLLPWHRTVAS